MSYVIILLLVIAVLVSFGTYFNKLRVSFLILFFGFSFLLLQNLFYNIMKAIISHFQPEKIEAFTKISNTVSTVLCVLGLVFLVIATILLSKEAAPFEGRPVRGKKGKNKNRVSAPASEPPTAGVQTSDAEVKAPVAVDSEKNEPASTKDRDSKEDETPSSTPEPGILSRVDPFPMPGRPKKETPNPPPGDPKIGGK